MKSIHDFRTPLGRVRGLGSAKDGTGTFWRQRLTAVANVPLLLFFVGLLISLNGATYDEVRAALASPLVAVVLILVILSAFVHMAIGMKEIIEDYAHDEGVKVALVIANIFFVTVVGAACVFSILKLAFGG
ncbi:MAG: succinate dehydrogenase, hydrophobic membrane anchor protein [Rhizobiaceae bacterium]|nr:succinate dehydrogenase, hydrophobic membrane anchor protein [Rhizobiaceae bacterium]MCV0407652.1 succinate dehydrogenase, hydrophobic membrane anchor protein [Rhizobiaceae bacterium]